MKIFLRLKHWQLFILMIGLPIILQFAAMSSVFVSNYNITLMMTLMPIVIILDLFLFFAWFYSLGIHLHEKLPAGVEMNIRWFRFFLFTPLTYMVAILIYFISAFVYLPPDGQEPDIAILVFILPLHFFAIFCIFYCLYFIAKCLRSVELKREVFFSDYAGEFFLMWFYVIGIWILQPRINKIFGHGDGSTEIGKGTLLDDFKTS